MKINPLVWSPERIWPDIPRASFIAEKTKVFEDEIRSRRPFGCGPFNVTIRCSDPDALSTMWPWRTMKQVCVWKTLSAVALLKANRVLMDGDKSELGYY